MVATPCLRREGGVGVIAVEVPKDLPYGGKGDTAVRHVSKELPGTQPGRKNGRLP